ncbi:hypothetical protein F5X68DRAFT_275230 [Plectosphaerella plurivora]|uniref:DUF2293 domain-containing protein n=1 Tax=Plectosphaerella plurivora TaxID=936078 RepID=A0A9P8VD73_9PEZI|nr:hypothetical protein F5X68DRAFT_275230 [Plectosphaerella plurivora]
MGREKKSTARPSTGKEKHRRTIKEIKRNAPLPPGLVARKAVPVSKHKTVLELVENKDFKKKPLDFENYTQREPPPLFSFVPLGNPELTLKCKDLSRERGAMVYIVSTPTHMATDLSHQMNRVGYHFRSQIVQEAKEELGIEEIYEPVIGPHGVEVIPESQQEINEQANAALWELFPKIPHTDRAEIISHAFRKGQTTSGEPLVGLQPTLSLFRRVQLAVLAHIRHNHTRYDYLLKETTWSNARRVTEEVCLDFLVKWRGDDESGKDQLDEIIREVVVLSDSDDSDDDEDSTSDIEGAVPSRDISMQARTPAPFIPGLPSGPAAVPYQDGHRQPQAAAHGTPQDTSKPKGKSKKALKRERRRNRKGLKRYENAWDAAVQRNRAGAQAPRVATPQASASLAAQNVFASHASSPRDVQAHMPHGGQPLPGGPGNDFDSIPARYRKARTPGDLDMGFGSSSGAYRRAPSPISYGHPGPGPGHIAQTKVRELVPSVSANPRAWPAGVRQTQLQDMLHPSIEPLSPGAPPPGQHSYRPMVHEPYTVQRHHVDPAREVIVIRESYEEPEPDMYPVAQPRHDERSRRLEPYEERAPAVYAGGPRYSVAAAPSRQVGREGGHVFAGEKHGAYPGMDQRLRQPRPQAEDMIMHTGSPYSEYQGSPARPFADGHPRMERQAWPPRETHTQRDGFMVLREHPKREERPRNEPFIQLREAPIIYSEPAQIWHLSNISRHMVGLHIGNTPTTADEHHAHRYGRVTM